MRTRLPILFLTAAFSLTGCELLVRFDPALIDGSTDASPDRVTVDAGDVPHAMDVQDVPPTMDVVDASDVPMDTVVVDATDVPLDTVIVDATDVQPDVQPDVQDAGTDTGVDVPVDTGTDAGPSHPAYNGCTYATAVDLTADSAPTITFPGASFTYTPSCIRITAGQMVTWNADTGSNFVSHPLQSGDVTIRTPESGSPIVATSTGTSVTFTFPTAGAYGFYCMIHSTMAGIVYVDP